MTPTRDTRLLGGRYGPTTCKPVDQVTHLDTYAWLEFDQQQKLIYPTHWTFLPDFLQTEKVLV